MRDEQRLFQGLFKRAFMKMTHAEITAKSGNETIVSEYKIQYINVKSVGFYS